MSKKIENPPVEENPDIVAHRVIEQKLKQYSNSGCPNTTVCCSCTSLLVAVIYIISVACTWQHSDTWLTARFGQVLVDYSPSWFAQVRVIPNDTRTQSFLLSEKPQAVFAPTTFYDQYTFSLNASYGYVGYKLLRDSEISMSYAAVPTFPLAFYIIDGADFEYWKNLWSRWGPLDGRFDDPIQFSTSPYGAVNYTCQSQYLYRAYQRVYFIWESTGDQGGTVYSNFTLRPKIYDSVAHRLQQCTGTCDFILDYGSSQVVLVSPFNMFANDTQETSSSTIGTSRFSTWISLGVGLTAPLALLAFAFFAPYLWLRFRLHLVKQRLYKTLDRNAINMCSSGQTGCEKGREKEPIMSHINAI
jgi:hypothetical protein